MLRKLLPQQKIFFEGFNSLGDILVSMSQTLLTAVNEDKFDDQAISAIMNAKEQAKAQARNLFTQAHKTFITPFDRQDIHSLNNEIYDAVNTINLTAQRCLHYGLHVFPDIMKKLVQICYDAAELVMNVLSMLSDLKHHTKILNLCGEIKEHESEADHLLIEGISELYTKEENIKTVLKLKEIYGLLESITDRYQMIAYIAEGIILEYS
jgi:hypothetical protein